MEKTVNFNLNKPEAGDPMRVSDFNDNADKIDAALNSVRNEAVSLSAQVRAEAANALAAYKTANDAAVAAGAKVQWGSYTGTGKYGSSTPNKLNFNFEPKLVLIVGFNHDNTSSQQPGLAVLVNGLSRAPLYFASVSSSGGNANSCSLTVTFSGNTVTYYSTYNYGQMNYSGNIYYYVALG